MVYRSSTRNGSLEIMYERPETAITKADVLSPDCTVPWFLTETYRGFRHKNVPLTNFASCLTFDYDILEEIRYGVEAIHAGLRGLVFICKFDK